MARTPATEAMLTIAPPPLASIAGISNFIPRNVPRMLVRMPTSNSSGSMSASGAGIGPSVALLNAASSRPNVSTAQVDERAHRVDVADVGLRGDGRARPPTRSSPTTRLQRIGVAGAQHDGVAGAGERSAVSAPMPRLAPATSATRWPSLVVFVMRLCHGLMIRDLIIRCQGIVLRCRHAPYGRAHRPRGHPHGARDQQGLQRRAGRRRRIARRSGSSSPR